MREYQVVSNYEVACKAHGKPLVIKHNGIMYNMNFRTNFFSSRVLIDPGFPIYKEGTFYNMDNDFIFCCEEPNYWE